MSVVALGAAVTQAEDSKWVSVMPPGKGFSVEMPLKPTLTVTQSPSFLGTVENLDYRAVQGKDAYIVNRVDLPGVATFFLSNASLLDRVRDEYIKQGAATEKSYGTAERDGHEGKTLWFVRGDADGEPEDGYAEFFIVDGTLYTFTGLLERGKDPANAKRYLSSIKFLED